MIIVFGSINLDLVVSVPRLPVAGETVVGPDHQSFPGGKGGNQALAARRAGAQVKMIGAVGRDEFADSALANLVSEAVDLTALRRLEGATGLALIGVDAKGENQIICASGVNARVSARWLEGELDKDDVLVLQRELEPEPIREAVRYAKSCGARILLNIAPAGGGVLADVSDQVDVIVANESEAAELACAKIGHEPETSYEGCLALASTERLSVVTLGSKGVIAAQGDKRWRVSPQKISAVDTTGAGDAFMGAFAAAVDRRAPVAQALAEGVAAGTLACLATGAQSSAPTAQDIQRHAQSLHVETTW